MTSALVVTYDYRTNSTNIDVQFTTCGSRAMPSLAAACDFALRACVNAEYTSLKTRPLASGFVTKTNRSWADNKRFSENLLHRAYVRILTEVPVPTSFYFSTVCGKLQLLALKR